ncbi:hypothetical protein NEDG_00738 [Nematocida displodere]|uniref:Amino acid transporter transmembrane domain-containing protein n=1 Tax=Nematocida displodere TaxID=1805483 RepID=A0A177ECD2_9MICR|nr:hypothetical protein NEDG_00738 [Nematocida displodere]
MGHEILTGHFNLLKTIIGSGIVSFPSFFAVFGIVPTVVFSCISAVLAFAGLMMLCECASFIGNSKGTFSSSLEDVLPGIAYFFNVIVFAKCFGVSISYLIILRPLLEYLAEEAGVGLSGEELIVIYALLMIPVCALKDLKSFRFTSLLGIFGAYVCLGGSVYNLVVIAKKGNMPVVKFFANPNMGWIKKVGQFVFCFTCHQNIFSIRSGLSHPTRSKMAKVVGSSIVSALVLYLTFGMTVYYTYGNNIEPNVFMSFEANRVKTAVVLFYSLLITCSYPLQVHPARDCLSEWLISATRVSSAGKAGSLVRVVSTMIIVGAGLYISLLTISLDTIQSVVGGTASAVMCNVIPAISLMYLQRKKTSVEKVFVILLLAYSVFSFAGVLSIFAKNK